MTDNQTTAKPNVAIDPNALTAAPLTNAGGPAYGGEPKSAHELITALEAKYEELIKGLHSRISTLETTVTTMASQVRNIATKL